MYYYHTHCIKANTDDEAHRLFGLWLRAMGQKDPLFTFLSHSITRYTNLAGTTYLVSIAYEDNKEE